MTNQENQHPEGADQNTERMTESKTGINPDCERCGGPGWYWAGSNRVKCNNCLESRLNAATADLAEQTELREKAEANNKGSLKAAAYWKDQYVTILTQLESQGKDLQVVREAMTFPVLLSLAKAGPDEWSAKPHNKKWRKRIDGTPIPNDLLVSVVKEISRSLARIDGRGGDEG